MQVRAGHLLQAWMRVRCSFAVHDFRNIGEEIVSCGDWKEKLEESNREKVIKGDKQAVGVAVALALGEEYA